MEPEAGAIRPVATSETGIATGIATGIESETATATSGTDPPSAVMRIATGAGETAISTPETPASGLVVRARDLLQHETLPETFETRENRLDATSMWLDCDETPVTACSPPLPRASTVRPA